jgi:hypothetical protein
MKFSNVVLICGMDGTGKSTLAGKLATRAGNAAVLAFATQLREMCIRDGFLTKEEAYVKPTPVTVRGILRYQSLQYKKLYGEDVFATRLRDYVESLPRELPKFIHDTRYLAELEAFRPEGCTIIYLGGSELTAEQKTMSSFKELPEIYVMADLRLPEKPSEDLIKNLTFH